MPIRLRDAAGGRYSQHGEEGVIQAVFKELGVKTGTCVDIGAFDLQLISNVYPLWTNGWKALLVEGDRMRFRKLLRQYASHPQASEQRVSIVNRLVAEEGPDSLDNILT